MTLHIISDALQQRVTAHLSQFGTLARSVLWTGRGSIVVHFTEPITTSATDQRFAPLTVNWSATFRSPDGAIYLNVPASWRKADREAGEGEANVTAELTPLMKDLLNVLADGAVAHRVKQEAHFADGRKVGFAANSLKGLIGRGFAEKRTSTDADVLPPVEEYVITAAGRAAINRPIADPTTPIPANELDERGYITVINERGEERTLKLDMIAHKPVWQRLTASSIEDVPQVLTRKEYATLPGVTAEIEWGYDDVRRVKSYHYAENDKELVEIGVLPVQWVRHLVDRA